MIKHSLLALAVLALAGCSGEPAPAPTPTGPPVAQSYASVVELKDAAVAAGYDCPNWVQSNRITLAASSGECSTRDTFAVYLTEQDVSTAVQKHKSFGTEVSLLVGPNWIINSKPATGLGALREGMGGVLVAQAEVRR